MSSETTKNAAIDRRAGARVDLQIIGGGLAGLIAANKAADAGLSVRLVEKRGAVGGRAGSADHQGFTLNQGPHALYLTGALDQALRSFGIEPTGTPPGLKGARGSIGQKTDLLPQGPGSLLRTSLLSAKGKRGMVAFMARLPRLEPEPLASVTVDRWLAQVTDVPELRTMLSALVTLSTYSSAGGVASADAAVSQLQMAMKDGVIYLDNGWQQIVDQLSTRLDGRSNVERATATVTSVTAAADPGSGFVCETNDGPQPAANVLVAVGLPAVADRLLGDIGLVDRAGPAVRAAVLDLGLLRPPPVDVLLGLDRALYLSTHSRAGAIAPHGRSLVTVAKYLAPGDEPEADATRAELLRHAAAAGIDEDDIVMDRYLHRLTVTGGMPTAANGGLPGRPPVAVPGRPGLYLAGDWVGPTGLLADASAASAGAAVDAVLAARSTGSARAAAGAVA